MINRKIDIETNKKTVKKKDNDDEKDDIWKLREGKVLLLTNVAVIFVFSIIYFILGDKENWNGITDDSNLFDFFYFSFTTMTTIGYGDVSPNVVKTKVICICQQLIVLFELANFFSNVIIKKPIKIKPLNIKLLKRRNSKSAITIGDKIGRQRRFNSCQLDYKSAENLINRKINVEEDENEVRIFLPLPPTTF
tara:strand:- start:1088 stop:1666 length:579 start_codon:yes stop_codon:yes gene_type:complete